MEVNIGYLLILPSMGLIVLSPLGSGAHPPTWPESLGDSAALRAMAGLPSMVALCSPLEEGLDLGEDSFACPHPTCSGQASFVVDDAAE